MADWDDNCPNCFKLTGYSAQAAGARRRHLVCTCAFGNDTGAAIQAPEELPRELKTGTGGYWL